MSRANPSQPPNNSGQPDQPHQGGSRTQRIRRKSKQRLGRFGTIVAFTFLVIVVVGLVAAGLMGAQLRTADPSLDTQDAVLLSAYLLVNQAQLRATVNPTNAPRRFEITEGEGASDIAFALLAEGYIDNADLFRRYARFNGLDRQFEAGIYEISASMTIPELARALIESEPVEISVRIPEGWRREQVAAWIDTQQEIPFTGAEFLAATDSIDDLPEGSPLVGVIPVGQTLEGFLYPDTYRLDVDAEASDLVDRMLAGFQTRVSEQVRADATLTDYTLHQLVTLASIVEREAAVPEERPDIARVYLNRLDVGQMLQADPTVQYGQGYVAARDEWWNTALTQADYTVVQSPYNTYLIPGLPPGPIVSPTAGSIEAVVYAPPSPFFYFRAACDGSGLHNFAVTFEEHLANACP